MALEKAQLVDSQVGNVVLKVHDFKVRVDGVVMNEV